MEKDEEYIKQVKNLGDLIEGDIKQNYAIDIYQVRLCPTNLSSPSSRALSQKPRRYAAVPLPRVHSRSALNAPAFTFVAAGVLCG